MSFFKDLFSLDENCIENIVLQKLKKFDEWTVIESYHVDYNYEGITEVYFTLKHKNGIKFFYKKDRMYLKSDAGGYLDLSHYIRFYKEIIKHYKKMYYDKQNIADTELKTLIRNM